MISQTRKVEAHQRHLEALQLRQAGLTLQQIADQLGYKTKSAVHRAIANALRDTLQEPADEVRALELTRLDRMLLAIWPQVLQGNQGAIDRALRVMERRAKLLGLDAPARQELTGADGGPLEAVGYTVETWRAQVEMRQQQAAEALALAEQAGAAHE